MAVVSQEVVLFSATIRQNIMYGNPNATESDMEEVAKLTNVDRIVEKFPQVNMFINVSICLRIMIFMKKLAFYPHFH